MSQQQKTPALKRIAEAPHVYSQTAFLRDCEEVIAQGNEQCKTLIALVLGNDQATFEREQQKLQRADARLRRVMHLLRESNIRCSPPSPEHVEELKKLYTDVIETARMAYVVGAETFLPLDVRKRTGTIAQLCAQCHLHVLTLIDGLRIWTAQQDDVTEMSETDFELGNRSPSENPFDFLKKNTSRS